MVTERVSEEHRADFGTTEREAQVPAGTGVDGIHREATRDRRSVGQAFLVELSCHFDELLSADPGADATCIAAPRNP
jgi:hypothetical protein